MRTELRGAKLEGRGAYRGPQRPPLRSHRDLDAYRRSLDLHGRVQQLCRTLAREGRPDLSNQMRRASELIPTNIAEGFGRKSSEKAFKQRMKAAMALTSQMESHLDVAGRLALISRRDLDALLDAYGHVGRQLHRLIVNWGHF